MDREIRIGIVGYSAMKFDLQLAETLLINAYDNIDREYPNFNKTIVSGLTDLGIPSLAYKEAVRRGWKTVGIACSRAEEYKCFPVDERIIVGNEWGEESPVFLESIDILIRVGGGEQSKRETALMREKGKPIVEYDLQILNN